MTDEDIADTISAFARGAEKAQEMGFDAIEIHAAHAFLLDDFLWEVTNRCTDQWGGKSLAERTRFTVEILRAVKSVLREEIPLFIRISQWKEQDKNARLAASPRELQEWINKIREDRTDEMEILEPENFGSWN